ncbi:MAG: hypothetical protein WC623_18610 [Pedobacter sp.]|jgi:2-methylaconitate cis-trans-isomerase PrpF|uniref:hypothetical protein n=1 Tax=Pedobacter sp. TaxID=1411316 RepID=UPI003569E395
MRKVFFFFGLLATVAVGHAVAKNATTSRLVPIGGPLNSLEDCTRNVPCTLSDTTIPCTFTTGPNIGTWYANDPETGKCTVTLYRIP